MTQKEGGVGVGGVSSEKKRGEGGGGVQLLRKLCVLYKWVRGSVRKIFENFAIEAYIE